MNTGEAIQNPVKNPRISVRIPKGSDLKQRLEAASIASGIDEVTLVLRCVEATVDYIEEHGEMTLPIVVQPKSSIKKTAGGRAHYSLNEDAPPYGKKSPPKNPKASGLKTKVA